MAKLGEGDPRWLVTNREDGKNVNNWHWSEQSLYPWMKDKLTSMFEKKGIAEDDECKVWINCLDSLTGEVFMSNRKGKRKFLWDLNMKLEWCGKMKMRRASDESGEEDQNKRTVKGKIECSNITVMDDDFDVKITIDDKERDADGLKLHSLAKKSTDIVRSVFKCAVEEMISSHQVSDPQRAAETTTDSKDSSKRILSSPAVQETDKKRHT
ncbi:activator of 90 kDa heat shock protein ATPase homolog [Schistocerca gregaria]|uniref:activator of 90 kDa heat shock protein ATPase homolog n=1 Tax=Schistocerca gregaria TaxID=7010 RepID=UPI00211E1647|nr:activator of 90 kDa heat shock protein ATPase homolog [Schistocerca gregaria]